MTYAPTNPYDVPPYQVQPLIRSVVENDLHRRGSSLVQVRCAQALGSEIYVGCSNGELLRFALQADDPTKLESYSLLSRQSLPNEKAVDEIVLVPSIARALVLSGTGHLHCGGSLSSMSTIRLSRTSSSFLHLTFIGSSSLEYNQTNSKRCHNCGRSSTSAKTSPIIN